MNSPPDSRPEIVATHLGDEVVFYERDPPYGEDAVTQTIRTDNTTPIDVEDIA